MTESPRSVVGGPGVPRPGSALRVENDLTLALLRAGVPSSHVLCAKGLSDLAVLAERAGVPASEISEVTTVIKHNTSFVS